MSQQKKEIDELRVQIAADVKILRERDDWIVELINERDAAWEEINVLDGQIDDLRTKVRPLVAQTHEVGTNSALAILQPASFEVKP